MNKEEILNVGVCCGSRSSQQTYNNFVKMYSYAKENGFKGINITFIDPELDKLQQKVNQLETNRDEAIEYIKHSWRLKFDQVYDTSKYLSGWEAEELLSILERGKE